MDDTGTSLALNVIWDLSLECNLTVYDAAYLELCIRCQIPIATRGRELAAAARAKGSRVLISEA